MSCKSLKNVYPELMDPYSYFEQALSGLEMNNNDDYDEDTPGFQSINPKGCQCSICHIYQKNCLYHQKSGRRPSMGTVSTASTRTMEDTGDESSHEHQLTSSSLCSSSQRAQNNHSGYTRAMVEELVALKATPEIRHKTTKQMERKPSITKELEANFADLDREFEEVLQEDPLTSRLEKIKLRMELECLKLNYAHQHGE